MADADEDGVGVVALRGVPEVQPGDDLAALLREAVVGAGYVMEPGDVLVVSSKVVSKAMGLVERTPRDHVVARESVRTVAARRTPRGLATVVQSLAGPVMAAAGVDVSNTPPGTVLTLPRDPDDAARRLRRDLRGLGLPLLAVVISDTAGRPWRTGQTDFALGVAGLLVTDDLRGTRDAAGQLLEVTERAVADEVAAATDLVKGKTSGTPAALVRGLGAFVTADDGPGAASLLRDAATDWFGLGPVEAVRAALGVRAGDVEAPSVLPEPLPHRARRAGLVARAGLVPRAELVAGAGEARDDGDGLLVEVRADDAFALGLAVQRLLVALWAEDLVGEVATQPSEPSQPGVQQMAVVRVLDGPAARY